MNPNRFRILILALALTAWVAPPTTAQETDQAEAAWAAVFRQARFEMGRGKMEAARDLFWQVQNDYDSVEVRDRAAAGIASTFLKERRYDEAIYQLGDAIRAGGDEYENSRRLYTAVERRIRRARNRARVAVRALQERYDEISWWNVFKLFEKLDRRKDLKDAEKDLEELEELHDKFEPPLLFPIPMITADPNQDGVDDSTEPAEGESAEEESSEENTEEENTEEESTEEESDSESEKPEDETPVATEAPTAPSEETSEEASEEGSEETAEETSSEEETAAAEGTEESSEETEESAPTEAAASEEAPAEESTGTSEETMSRQTARDILAEEISALVALIPEDRLAEADAILDQSDGDEGTEEESAEAAEADEAAEEEASEESGSSAAEGSLELLPGAPGTSEGGAVEEGEGSAESDGDATPEATVETPSAPDTTAAAVTSAGELRNQYYASYRRLQEALTSGDQEAIKTAREDYLGSVGALRGARQAAAPAAPAAPSAPSAPASSSTSPTAAASVSPSPAAPAPAATAPAPSVNPTGGTFRRDRTGTQRGLSDGTLRQSRGSFHR